jgi:hypothetical protein
MKTDYRFFEMVEKFKYLGTAVKKLKFYSGRNLGQIEVRKCLLLFGAEPFAFQFAIQKFKD